MKFTPDNCISVIVIAHIVQWMALSVSSVSGKRLMCSLFVSAKRQAVHIIVHCHDAILRLLEEQIFI
jgi:hypothetical protein